MKRAVTTPAILLAASMPLLACSYAGAPRSGIAYGEAVAQNQFVQVAYKDQTQLLRDLSIDFAAETQDTVTFAFNKASLDSGARNALRGQATWLKDHPAVRMTIIGHTDKVGSESYNERLGLRRARAVVAFLASLGISKSRLDAVESEGERDPIVATDERERRNRRAVTTVAGFDRYYVGDNMDGERALNVYDAWQAGETGIEDAETQN